ncbi:MAG: hypothetical protein PQJ61_01985 [Spirochaetales bacterium]|uniref:Uncharacterized protein n=1 Tax=Candidatus Thalassospirochaeta sargassi TaxID=3119039 RepID=A0AAJ1IG19_9SPIO|nr:hypothetical protein [Spirochaetales bacterium]
MIINESDKQKATAFIQRLMANPALKSFSLLQREEQIIQFLTVNSRQLYPTLSSQAFFPGKSWDSICAILVSVLYELTDNEVLPDIRLLINRLDFTFFTFLRPSNLDEGQAKQVVMDFLQKMLANEQARRIFTGSLAAVNYNIVKKYTAEIYRRKKYIHFELLKVEKLKMGEREVENMINLVMLLKPMIYLFSQQANVMKNTANGNIFPCSFTETLAKNLSAKAQAVPPQVFSSSMNANASFADNSKLEASARLGNVFSAMCRNYKPDTKKDRGADTAMKSWINVARKNYKFYGYDIKMLDELYNIAADNGW